jgi:glucose-6-phosphate 1-epimerase
MRAAELTAEFGIARVLDFVETEQGLVKAAISLEGVTGELFLQGAQVTAWRPSDERPVLFTSPNSAFVPGRAIRGGIPIVFPWFGASRHTPTAPQHGFARTATWHLDGAETAGGGSLTLTLSLGDGDAGSPFWPERFRAIYTVTFAQTLSLRLAVIHRGNASSKIAGGAAASSSRRRRCVARGVEPLGRKSDRYGRSRRPRLARHGLRRDREYRRQRGSPRRRC